MTTAQNISTTKKRWALSWRERFPSRELRWSLRVLGFLLFVALFSDFIANDKPIWCKMDGQNYFPIFREYAANLGISNQEVVDWRSQKLDRSFWPLIPYAADTQDRRNRGFVGPFDEQRIPSQRYRHWLGTDQLGRDIAAGMVAGTRVAMLVGVIAMSIATIIGILLGSLAGFFGDNGFRVSRIRLLLNLVGFFLAVFYAFMARSYQLSSWVEWMKSMGIFIGILLLTNILAMAFEKVPLLGKRLTIPLDLFIMRFIEVLTSIPGLLLLLALVALIEKQSVYYVMAIIGLIGWTGIARFVRAEMLKIRQLEYIEAARVLGLSEWRIMWRHALPNALTPVVITIAFGMASAILLEAFLSFLGIGVALNEVTWGKLLSEARNNVSAWWLAVFPGTAIFITVLILNLLGEQLRKK